MYFVHDETLVCAIMCLEIETEMERKREEEKQTVLDLKVDFV